MRSDRLSFPYLAEAQAQKHVTVNDTVRALDALVHLQVRSRTQMDQPANPVAGDAYILPPGKTGEVWSTYPDHAVTVFQDGAWTVYPAVEGVTAWVAAEAQHRVWNGTGWIATGGGLADPLQLGVNATADGTNRLAVKSDAILHSHDDITPGSGDARHVINKNTASDTASVLLQSGFSGRAEIGLTGSDDLAIRVSPDGINFLDAIVIDRQTGAVRFPNTAQLRGSVTTSAVRAALDAYQPASGLPQTVVLEKLRTDFPEFALYIPVTSDGLVWARHLVTNRFFQGNTGAPVVSFVTLAELYAGVPSPIPDENGSTGTMAVPPAVVLGTSDATSRDGSFNGPATINGVDDITYTDLATAAVTYRAVVPEAGRIIFRALNFATNGGVAQVSITDDNGVPIPDDLYRCVSDGTNRIVNLKNQQVNSGRAHVPLTADLPAGTYDVTLTLPADNPTGERLYDGGIMVMDPISFDAVGLHGVGYGYTSPQNLQTLNIAFPGTVVVYRLDDATRVVFNYHRTTVNTMVAFRLYDAVGTQLPLSTSTYDLYGGIDAAAITVADDLAKGTYYLHVESLPERNASALNYRMFPAAATAVDTGSAGTPGTDRFDLLSLPPGATPLNPGGHMLLGPANLEYAAEWRPVGSSPGDENFVGGVHNAYESHIMPADLSLTVDGAPVNIESLPVGELVSGVDIRISFESTLFFPQGGAAFATLAYDYRFSRNGYQPVLTRTLTQDAICHIDYALMVQAPNGGDGRSDALGGGLSRVYADAITTASLDQSDERTIASADLNVAYALTNGSFAVYGALDNAAAIAEQFAGPLFQTGANRTTMRDLATHQLKVYTRLFPGDDTNGVLLSAGHVSVTAKTYRVFKGTELDAVLSG